MSSIRTILKGYLSYRGKEGHWTFLLHRLTGLGVLLFLLIHILDTSMVFFYPRLYEEALALYRSTLFGIGEIFLVFCVIFHGVNGLRVALLDMAMPEKWQFQKFTSRAALVIALLLWAPAAFLMLRSLWIHNFSG